MKEFNWSDMAGTWKLLDYEFLDGDGNVWKIWGDDPVGVVIFDDKGRYSAQIMRRDRPDFSIELSPTPEEVMIAARGYVAYFGRAEINLEEEVIINHVEGALVPNWVGGRQIRNFEFEGDNLILRPPPIKLGDRELNGRVAWEKI